MLEERNESQADSDLLAHLQRVIWHRISENRPLFMSWTAPGSAGPCLQTVLIHGGVPLRFEYARDGAPPIVPDWLDALTRAAEQPDGLFIY